MVKVDPFSCGSIGEAGNFMTWKYQQRRGFGIFESTFPYRLGCWICEREKSLSEGKSGGQSYGHTLNITISGSEKHYEFVFINCEGVDND